MSAPTSLDPYIIGIQIAEYLLTKLVGIGDGGKQSPLSEPMFLQSPTAYHRCIADNLRQPDVCEVDHEVKYLPLSQCPQVNSAKPPVGVRYWAQTNIS